MTYDTWLSTEPDTTCPEYEIECADCGFTYRGDDPKEASFCHRCGSGHRDIAVFDDVAIDNAITDILTGEARTRQDAIEDREEERR